VGRIPIWREHLADTPSGVLQEEPTLLTKPSPIG
jgi:hypothetical protein